MRRVKKKIHLYHLSDDNCNNKIFKPRIPKSAIDDPKYENQKIKRVCFSSSMAGAVRAISYGDVRFIQYVHVPENIDDIINSGNLYKPDDTEVYDTYYTGEYWVTQKVKMKCIGVAEFYYEEGNYWDLQFRPNVKIRWIEKYE